MNPAILLSLTMHALSPSVLLSLGVELGKFVLWIIENVKKDEKADIIKWVKKEKDKKMYYAIFADEIGGVHRPKDVVAVLHDEWQEFTENGLQSFEDDLVIGKQKKCLDWLNEYDDGADKFVAVRCDKPDNVAALWKIIKEIL